MYKIRINIKIQIPSIVDKALQWKVFVMNSEKQRLILLRIQKTYECCSDASLYTVA
jgi:hypothetical protein